MIKMMAVVAFQGSLMMMIVQFLLKKNKLDYKRSRLSFRLSFRRSPAHTRGGAIIESGWTGEIRLQRLASR